MDMVHECGELGTRCFLRMGECGFSFETGAGKDVSSVIQSNSTDRHSQKWHGKQCTS